MYFTSLPDHKKPGFDEAAHFDKFRKHNIIFNAMSSKSDCYRHVGCLSVKTVLSGEEWYRVDNRDIAIRPGQFLVLNNSQEYSCRIDGPGKVNVLSIFFREQFARSVLRDVLCREETLLDNYLVSGEKVPEFFQTLKVIEPSLQKKMLTLVATLNDFGYDVNRVDEHLVFLLHELIHKHKMEVRLANRVKAVKPSTKKEIYKRLCIAKDFMYSSFSDKPDLRSITNIACLSTPQLIRHFKAVFKVSPHQYLTRVRLEHAAGLLKHSETPVYEITRECGFENTSSFCRLFKKEYGVSPVNFRMLD